MSWLIELGSSPPEWWTGKYAEQFSCDANNAISFERFEDAERARCYLVKEGWRNGSKSVEHMWIEPQTTEHGPAGCMCWCGLRHGLRSTEAPDAPAARTEKEE